MGHTSTSGQRWYVLEVSRMLQEADRYSFAYVHSAEARDALRWVFACKSLASSPPQL